MKMYDAKKVRRLITSDCGTIRKITLGMSGDFGCTTEEVYRNGRLLVPLDGDTVTIGDHEGSEWATPTMVIEYYDDRTVYEPCFFVA